MEVVNAFTFLFLIRVVRPQPINMLESALIPKSNALITIGHQFQQWGEQNKHYVVPHYGGYGRERAVQENEGAVSKYDTAYTQSQQWVAELAGHKPLLDTIQEHEKYGNDGEAIRKIGISIINGLDAVANVANALLDAPNDKIRRASKQATAVLNVIGAKINGI